MNLAWLFLSWLFYLAAVEYREVNGFTFDDLDFVRSAIEDVSKSITSKPATKISRTPLRVASHGYHKYSTADSIVPLAKGLSVDHFTVPLKLSRDQWRSQPDNLVPLCKFEIIIIIHFFRN